MGVLEGFWRAQIIIFVTGFGPNFDDSVTKICICDTVFHLWSTPLCTIPLLFVLILNLTTSALNLLSIPSLLTLLIPVAIRLIPCMWWTLLVKRSSFRWTVLVRATLH